MYNVIEFLPKKAFGAMTILRNNISQGMYIDRDEFL